MGIKIKNITVKNLGPIQHFSEDFGLFNIIYSKNECGKTFLTEFIIRSLFKNIKRWDFREKGTGKVLVSGLDESRELEFSPDTVKKMEDYWEGEEKGMPLSMVNLLVSKGGEASIEASDEGISKGMIREIFSGISLLDRIDSDRNISKTVKSAEIDEEDINNITISNTGEGKNYRQLQEDVNRIDNLFAEVESKYSPGIIESCRAEEERLRNVHDKLQRAKQYRAYTISEEIKGLNRRLQKNDEDIMDGLSQQINLYESKKREHGGKSDQLKELHEKCKNFDWLQKALTAYERFAPASVKKPHIVIPILEGILVVAAILFSVFNIQIGIIASIVIAAGLGAFYIVKLLGALKNAGLSNELDGVKKEFKKRTGRELSDIASLNVELENEKESFDRSKLLTEQLVALKIDIQDLVLSIQQKFNDLTGEKLPESLWISTLNDKKMENRRIRDEIDSLRQKQSELGVREVEYLSEDPGIGFSYKELEKVSSDFTHIQEQIKNMEEELENLKYRIFTETDDDPSIEWDTLLENLRFKRIEQQGELDSCKANIIAGVLVHEEITLLREEEDKKIQEGLQSDVVLKPLLEITDNYKKLTLQGERLLVSDDYRSFCLKDLSTGIKEQIMLALRIGFSSKILKQDTLFLILDDAFQHSDWGRRKMLVKKLADIAKTGWQVIYLSMDDHIRQLFDNEGVFFDRDQYRSIELRGL